MSGTYPGAEQPRRLGGRYELGAVLGRGGMAEVFMARDTRLGRTVAVKTLRADLSRDPTFQARFRREAQSAASLNHPAIVAIYDTGEDFENGVSVPYIVMEYADGSTLRDLLHSGRRLLPERALEITAGVLQALDYSPPQRHHPPRHQAREHHADPVRHREGDGLRHRPGHGRQRHDDDADRRGHRHGAVPVAGAGQGRDRRRPQRPVLHRLPDVRTAHRPAAVRRRLPGRRGLPARARGAAAAVAPTTPRSARRSTRWCSSRWPRPPTRATSRPTEMRADIERVLDGRPTEAQTAVLGAANMPTQRLDPRQVGAAAAVGQTRAMPAVDAPTGYQQPAAARYGEGTASRRPPAGPAAPRRAAPSPRSRRRAARPGTSSWPSPASPRSSRRSCWPSRC